MNNQERLIRLNSLAEKAKELFGTMPRGDLTTNEIASLAAIDEGSKKKGSHLTMSEAGDRIGLCRSAMSQLVARLERKGMLSREIVLWDRRKTLVKLTTKGKKLVDDMKEALAMKVQSVVEILGEENVDRSIELLEQYFNAFEGDK